MAYSKITITFNSLPSINEVLNFIDTSIGLNFDETFKAQRLGSKQVAIPSLNASSYEMVYSESEDISNIGVIYKPSGQATRTDYLSNVITSDNLDGTRTAFVNSEFQPNIVDMTTMNQIVWSGGNFVWVGNIYNGFISENYRNAFNFDYNTSSLFTVTSINGSTKTGLGVVVIEANYPNAFFVEVSVTADVTILIENVVTEDFSIIAGNNFSQASVNPCDQFKLTIETNELADTIIINNQLITDSNTVNPYVVELIRGVDYMVVLRRAISSGYLEVKFPVNGSILNIPKLIPDYFNIKVLSTLSGADVTVESNFPQGSMLLDLEYSLDGIDWQTTNKFPGLGQGEISVYIRDSKQPSAYDLGCSIIIPTTVDEIGSRTPYVKISKANSINYALVEEVDNCSTFRNDENSLAYQSLSKEKYCDEILFSKCDKPVTQIHSNYRAVTAILRNELNNTEANLNVIKRSNNLSRFQSMDALIYSYSPGISAIYFEDGNTYDEFGLVSGSFSLLGNLPDFAKKYNIVQIEGLGVFEIKDAIFDFEINKKIILIEKVTVSGLPELIIVSSIYDLINFEVYEFELNCLFLASGLYDIVITNSNSLTDNKQYISENIYVEDSHKDTLYIMYFGKNNRDIFYKYGIKNIIRNRYQNVIMDVSDDVDSITVDDSTSITKSTVKDGNTFIFDEIPRDFAFKLIIALSLEYVFINGTGYVKKNNVSAEVIENTNLYKVTAEMIKTGIIYTSIGAKEEFVDIDTGEQVTFPKIITDGTNFIKA